MKSIKNIKSYFEQSIIISLLLVLMGSFISLGFYVVEKNMYDIMGTYETPSVMYFTQHVDEEEFNQSSEHSISTESDPKESQFTGVNNLAMVLDAKIEKKAHSGISWIVDKMTIGLEYMADLLSKTLQSS